MKIVIQPRAIKDQLEGNVYDLRFVVDGQVVAQRFGFLTKWEIKTAINRLFPERSYFWKGRQDGTEVLELEARIGT